MTSPSIKEALELLPCPLCGSKFLMGREPHDNHPVEGKFYLFHDCSPLGSPAEKCPIDVRGHFNTAEEAAAIWNTRATLQSSGERREAIARILADPKHQERARYVQGFLYGDDHVIRDVALRENQELFRTKDEHEYEQRLEIEKAKFAADAILASGLVQNEAGWQCAARKQSLPEPADCNWPMCGCDPYADKVIAALQESEPVSRIEELEAENAKLRRFLKCSRDEGTEALDRADKAEKALEAAIRSTRNGGTET